ncbi:unnamed protein product [Protopolystoma xenopodis]|uniref:Uncharacterized protein n=1 Tax=Protopolystoma xenopodis TaxID=117903 RepID=A0A448WN66_9PLAT|nr:unnamed protein product [Protopolystoma xenopodis]
MKTVTREVFSWGDNDEGQLGNGSTTAISQPRLVKHLHSRQVILVACGSAHSFAWAIDAYSANSNFTLGSQSKSHQASSIWPLPARDPPTQFASLWRAATLGLTDTQTTNENTTTCSFSKCHSEPPLTASHVSCAAKTEHGLDDFAASDSISLQDFGQTSDTCPSSPSNTVKYSPLPPDLLTSLGHVRLQARIRLRNRFLLLHWVGGLVCGGYLPVPDRVGHGLDSAASLALHRQRSSAFHGFWPLLALGRRTGALASGTPMATNPYFASFNRNVDASLVNHFMWPSAAAGLDELIDPRRTQNDAIATDSWLDTLSRIILSASKVSLP